MTLATESVDTRPTRSDRMRGPALTVGGRTLVSLPFAIARLPILGYALPARLAIGRVPRS